MNKAFISIGSNIGERHIHIEDAIRLLDEESDLTVDQVSSIYETEPVGYTEQDLFLNVVIKVSTKKNAFDLLKVCQSIEQKLGRERTIRWGPRTVDLDILLFNEEVIQEQNLIVPHPRMAERAFVLVPLLEIAPDITSPLNGMLYKEKEAAQENGVYIWRGNE